MRFSVFNMYFQWKRACVLARGWHNNNNNNFPWLNSYAIYIIVVVVSSFCSLLFFFSFSQNLLTPSSRSWADYTCILASWISYRVCFLPMVIRHTRPLTKSSIYRLSTNVIRKWCGKCRPVDDRLIEFSNSDCRRIRSRENKRCRANKPNRSFLNSACLAIVCYVPNTVRSAESVESIADCCVLVPFVFSNIALTQVYLHRIFSIESQIER